VRVDADNDGAVLKLWILWVPLLGVAAGAVLSLIVPRVSRRAGVRRARQEGAAWSGMASFDAAAAGQAPVVRAALAGVGRLYGQRFSGRADQRPVGGHLSVFGDRLEWHPWRYLGRGKARPFMVPRTAVTGWEVVKLPLPAMSGYDAALHTADGPIRCLVVDGDGLEAALAGRCP
jgi:hypothetical protein